MGINIKDPNNNNILIDSPSANTFTISSSGTERLRINSSGNIGIGTSNPNVRLQVEGSVGASAPASGYATLDAGTSTHTGYVSFYNSSAVRMGYVGYAVGNSSGTMNLFTDTGNALIFGTNSAERMRITSSGDIGIGTADPVGRRLYVSNSGDIENTSLTALNSSYTKTVQQLFVNRSNSSAYNFLVTYSSLGGDIEHNLRGDGAAFADGTWSGGGADYAEYFEWEDGNPENEDRRGISVALEGTKIRPAQEGDEIIGVISGNPSVVGDASWNKWSGKYLRDEFGSYIFEDYEVLQWVDEEGNEKTVDADSSNASEAPEDATVVIQQRRKLNPDYDPDQEYIPREDRPEWAAVGLVGKLRLRKGQPVGDRWIKMQDISDSVEEWLVR